MVERAVGPTEVIRGKFEGPEHDRLGRAALVQSVTNLLCLPPDGFGVRVGLYGTWGEGKTTVLHLVASCARERGHAVARLDAWRARSEEHFWELVVDAIAEAVRGDKPLEYWAPPATEWYRRAGRWVKARLGRVGAVAEDGVKLAETLEKLKAGAGSAATAAALAGAVSAAAGAPALLLVLGFALKHILSLVPEPREQVRIARKMALVDKVLREQTKRVIIQIDELDRTAPSLLAPIMLGLRELLDHPALSFVLAFDEALVSHALEEGGGRWGEAHRYLEKVIEFPFRMPSVSVEMAWDLIEHMRATDFPELDRNALHANRKLLPTNPRRLRLLARNIWVSLQLASRVRQDWSQAELVLSQILRTASADLARYVLQDEGFGSALQLRAIGRRDEKDAASAWADAKEAAIRAGHISARDREWVAKILERLIYHAFHLSRLRVLCFASDTGLLVSPSDVRDAITKGPPDMDGSARRHGVSVRAYVEALLDAEIDAWEDACGRVTQYTTEVATIEATEWAQKTVSLLTETWKAIESLEVGDLTDFAIRCLKAAERWSGWDSPGAMSERVNAERLCVSAAFESRHVDVAVARPVQRDSPYHGILAEIVSRRLSDELLELLPTLETMMFPSNRRDAYLEMLFDVEGTFWTRNRKTIVAMAESSRSSGAVGPFVEWLEAALHYEGEGNEAARRFLTSEDGKVVWIAATSNRVRLAHLNMLRKLRGRVLELCGRQLPVPAWYEGEESRLLAAAAQTSGREECDVSKGSSRD